MQNQKPKLELTLFLVFLTILLQLCLFENKTQAMVNTAFSPVDDATDVPINSNFVITFSQNWTVGIQTGTIEIHQQGGALVESYNFPSYPANITGEGTANLTINPSADLSPNTNYYITISDEIIWAQFGIDHFNGITDATTWNFRTGACYNPPSCIGPCFGNFLGIKHLSPPDNARFMQSYEGIGIIFNGNVTVGSGNIIIRKYSDDTAFETINVNSSRVTGWGTDRIKIDPVGNLADNTQYYINFDIEGWSLTGDKDKWNFWTKSTPNTFSGTGL